MQDNYTKNKSGLLAGLGVSTQKLLELNKKRVKGEKTEMDDLQFELWKSLLESRTGMSLPDNRKSFLVANLGMRMTELGITSFQAYYDHVQSGLNGSVEWDQLLHHLTVHETRFLRHQSTLDLIQRHCLPQTLAPATSKIKPTTINIWSVGCSTGEEPYSIAMTVDEQMLANGYTYYLGIIASDISRNALAKGREGTYSARQVSKISQEWRLRYFQKLSGNKYQVIPNMRQRVCFNHLNILDMGDTPIGNMDVIVCQNVLIYYDKKRRLEIADSLVKYLAPGGMLIFAVGELLHWPNERMIRFQYPDTLAYRLQS